MSKSATNYAGGSESLFSAKNITLFVFYHHLAHSAWDSCPRRVLTESLCFKIFWGDLPPR